jgi:sensor histidine kinase YesM
MEGRLTYDLECAPELAGEQIPALLLQPLVENAVLHGVDDDRHALHVWVTVEENRYSDAQHQIHIQVGNSTDTELGSVPGAGVGLRNAQMRLAACYQGHASLEAQSAGPGRFTVDICAPLVNDGGRNQAQDASGA